MSDSPVVPLWSVPARLLPDSRLTRLAQEGDRRAFEVIFRRHQGELYRYCRAILGNDHDAQDALQSTMAAALGALPGEGREIPLRPWLFRVAHNEAITIARRRSREGSAEEPELAAASAHADAERRERLRILVGDLWALPERQRGALIMRELSGLSYRDIAKALSISEGAARQTVYEAREAMREAELGRGESCRSVREVLSLRDGRMLRGRRVRAHLRTCEGCADFRLAIDQRRADLKLIAPPIGAGAAAALLGGGGLFGGGAGTVAGAGATATGASLLGKATAMLAIAAAGTGIAAGTGAIDVPGLMGGDDPRRAAGAPAATPGWQKAGGPSERSAPGSAARETSGPGAPGGRSGDDARRDGGRAQEAPSSGAASAGGEPAAPVASGSSGEGVPAGGSDGATGPPPQAPGYGPPASAGTGAGNAGGSSATAPAAAPRSDAGAVNSNAGVGAPPEHASGSGKLSG